MERIDSDEVMNENKKVRVLIVDDHAVVREGLAFLASVNAELEIVGQAEDGVKGVELFEKLEPDVTVLDLVMPRMDGIETIKAIKDKDPKARILVLTSFSEEDRVFAAIKAGASGYLLKDAPPKELIKAIFDVYKGEAPLNASIAKKLIRELKHATQTPGPVDPLTEREIEVLKLIAGGLTNQEIAKMLFVSIRTVGVHVHNILDKLHLANRTQAALYALREGLAKLERDD